MIPRPAVLAPVFTQEDADDVRWAAGYILRNSTLWRKLTNLADRIETALLPLGGVSNGR